MSEKKQLQSRKNIFDMLSEKFDYQEEIRRIFSLFSKAKFETGGYPFSERTIFKLVDERSFPDWRQRYTSIDLDDIMHRLGITRHVNSINISCETDVLKYLEFSLNLIMLAELALRRKDSDTSSWFADDSFFMAKENAKIFLEKINYEAKSYPKEEKIIIVEKNAAATAVAEIVDAKLAYDVIEYNHYLLRGNVARKREIILAMSDKYEGIQKKVSEINAPLDKNITFLINNLNLRHNNLSGKHKKDHTIALNDEKQLESWYDEVYQCLLLAFLLEDHYSNRDAKINDLKKEY